MNTLHLILIFISILFFLGYNIPIIIRYKVQTSISATIKVLPSQWKFLYSLFMIGTVLPIIFVSGTNWGWWAGSLLLLDAAAPAGGNKVQQFLHNFGADAGIGVAMGMLIFNFHAWYFVLIWLAFSWYAADQLKNHTIWIEIGAWVVVIVELLIKTL